MSLSDVSAVSFDFFNTLVTPRHGLGRGALVMEYFRAAGWESGSWEHAVLYDVFAAHGAEFEPEASLADHRVFCARVARTLISRMRVQVDPSVADHHGIELWRILGPDHFMLFPDVERTLDRLRKAGLRLVIVSNWQCGLAPFCRALGIAEYFESVLASAEVGWEKPATAIFEELCRRLGFPRTAFCTWEIPRWTMSKVRAKQDCMLCGSSVSTGMARRRRTSEVSTR